MFQRVKQVPFLFNNCRKTFFQPYLQRYFSDFLKQSQIQDEISNDFYSFLMKKYDDKSLKEVEYYDAILDVTNLKHLQEKGWNVHTKRIKKSFKVDDKNIFEFLKLKKFAYVCVLGNFNRGKTWILQNICDINLPQGYTTRTKGISIKALQDKHLVLLDTAGFEQPSPIHILLKEFLEQINFEQKKKLLSLPKNKQQELILEILQRYNQSKQFIEATIQEFIIQISNVLILVIDQMTFNDQKFITRIYKQYAKTKTIYIIHNFKNLTEVSQVENSIEEFILQNFSVEVRGGNETKVLWKKTREPVYFVDINYMQFLDDIQREQKTDISSTNKNVIHLILAKDGSPAGQFFNQFTFKYLKKVVDGKDTDQQDKDVLQAFIQFFQEKRVQKYCQVTDTQLATQEESKAVTSVNKSDDKVKYITLENFQDADTFKPTSILYKLKWDKRFIINRIKENYINDIGFIKIASDKYKQRIIKQVKEKGKSKRNYLIWEIDLPGFSNQDIITTKFSRQKFVEGFYQLNAFIQLKIPQNQGEFIDGEPRLFQKDQKDIEININSQLMNMAEYNITRVRKPKVEILNGKFLATYIIEEDDDEDEIEEEEISSKKKKKDQ